jgi:hypothetical protein
MKLVWDFCIYGTDVLELLLGNGPRTRRCKATRVDKEEEGIDVHAYLQYMNPILYEAQVKLK